MQIAVCCSDEAELRRIALAVEALSAETGRSAAVAAFPTEGALWREFRPGRFRGAVVGYGDVKGFLCARRIREEDKACRVVLLDDTERFAIRGLRIHLSGFLLRPLEEERLRTAVRRLLAE